MEQYHLPTEFSDLPAIVDKVVQYIPVTMENGRYQFISSAMNAVFGHQKAHPREGKVSHALVVMKLFERLINHMSCFEPEHRKMLTLGETRCLVLMDELKEVKISPDQVEDARSLELLLLEILDKIQKLRETWYDEYEYDSFVKESEEVDEVEIDEVAEVEE
jgi:hypothetical protein